jgi:hypothetical protein
LNGIITAIERDNEVTGFIIRLSADKFGIKSQNVHVLLEHFLHVNLRSLWSKRVNRAERIFRGSIAVINRLLGFGNNWSWYCKFNRVLLNTHIHVVPSFGEIITIIDEAFSSINCNFLSANKITWAIILLRFEAHARAMSKNRSLSKSLLFEKHGERSTARVLGVNFFDFNLAIGKIIVEYIELVSTIISAILPENVERENLAIIIQE